MFAGLRIDTLRVYFTSTGDAGIAGDKLVFFNFLNFSIKNYATTAAPAPVQNVAPTFVGATTSADAAQNGVAISLASLLHISDSDTGQPLTWSQSVGPSHGTLSFSNATADSGGTDITPGGTITYSPTAGYAGSDSFTVQVSDGVTTATRVITVNVTPMAPTTPALAAASDSGDHTDHLTNSATLSFSGEGAAADSASTVRVFIDVDGSGGYNSGDISGTAIMSSGAWTVDNLSTVGLADGTYHVYATTSAGSLTSALSAALDVTIDKTVPTITFSALALFEDSGTAGDFITNTAAQSVTATLSAPLAAGDVVEGTIDGTNWVDISNMVAGTALTWNGVVLNASGTLQVRVTDKAGNSGTPAGHAYTVDSGIPAAPSTPALSAASDSGTLNYDHITNVTLPELSGTGEANASVHLYDENGNDIGSTTANGSGDWTIISTDTLSDGSHNLTAEQTDAAGNVSTASSPLTVVIDTTAPTAIALSAGTSTEAGATAGTTIATLSATDAHAVSYSLVAGSNGDDASNAQFIIVGDALKPIANLAVGTYHVYVDAVDAAGNHGQQALTFVVANGPSVSSIIRADGGGASIVAGAATSLSYTVTFSEAVTGVDAGDFTLTTTGNAGGSIASISPNSGSSDTYTVTITGLTGDGIIRLDLNASGTGIQNAGSTAIIGGYGAGGQTLILDHTIAAPTAPALDVGSDSGVSDSDGISGDAMPIFTGHAERNASVRLYDTDGTLIGNTTANGAGEWTITSSTLAQGTHTLTAQQTDRAGNVSAASESVSYTLDSSAPTAIALGSRTIVLSTAVNGATLTTLSSTDTSAVSYELATGNNTNDADNGKFNIVGGNLMAAQNLLAGTYHIYVKATDAAGNVGVKGLTFDVVDAPAVDSIVRTDGAFGNVPTDATSISYTVTFTQAVTGVDAGDFTLYSGGTATGTISAITPSGVNGDTYIVTVTGLGGDGALRLDLNSSGTNIKNADAVDIVGGYTSGRSFWMDHTAADAPATPAMAVDTDSGAPGDAMTSNTTPEFTGIVEANATVKLYDTNGTTLLGTTIADGDGKWTITSDALSEGGHTLTVTQTDAWGNVSAASGGLAVVIDTIVAAPGTPVLANASDSGALGDHITNIVRPTITGTAEAYGAVKLYDSDGTTLLGRAVADASGNWSILSSALAEGSHTLTVKQSDRANNMSVASAALTLIIDTTAPNAPGAPVLTTASDSGTIGDGISNIAAPVFTGTADANASVKLYDSNGTTLLGTATANGEGVWSITSSILSVGAHSLTVKQIDAAGNISQASTATTLTIVAPPVEPTTPTPPPTTVDGVPVTEQPVTLPGGGTGTQIVIPVVTPGRDESSGNAGVADIPLATNGTANVLLAQLSAGFGLTATGGASQAAGSSTEQLIQAILASTPDHSASDQGHLTGNGVVFLNQLASTVPLLVQTITPTGGSSAGGALTLTGTSTDAQHTALVIDASNLAPGAQLVLNAVDFAAIVGAANVTGNTNGQILTGDLANQQFTVGAGSNSSVFAGGGGDTLVFNTTTAAAGPGAQGATLPAGTTILHGGLGDDAATFNGASTDYTVTSHDGYVVVTANAQPNQHALVINAESLKFSDTTVAVQNRAALDAITGLYQDVLGRQADYLGVEFWATAEKNGVSLGKIALDLIGSAEAQAKQALVFNGDSAHDVELLYQGIFSRASDADGLAFWVGQMAKGMTLVEVANGFMASAEITGHKIGAQDWDFQMG